MSLLGVRMLTANLARASAVKMECAMGTALTENHWMLDSLNNDKETKWAGESFEEVRP